MYHIAADDFLTAVADIGSCILGGKSHPLKHRNDVIVVFDNEIVVARFHQRSKAFDIRARAIYGCTGVELRIDQTVFGIRVDHHIGNRVVDRIAVEVTAADHCGNAVVIGFAFFIEVAVQIGLV